MFVLDIAKWTARVNNLLDIDTDLVKLVVYNVYIG